MFKPGVSGNPGGRPKLGSAWKDIIHDMLGASKIDMVIKYPPDSKRRRHKQVLKIDVENKKSFRHALTARQIELALAGNTEALKDLIDRDLGRPQQFIDHTTNDQPLNVTYNFEGKSPEDLRKIRELLQKGKNVNDA